MSPLRGRAFDDPLDISALRSWRPSVAHFCHDFLFGAPLEPLLNLRVSISETETAGAVVVAGGQIVPTVWLRDAGDQPAVIDAIGMFIRENPEAGRGWIDDVGHSIIAPIFRKPSRAACNVIISESFNKSVHGIATNAWHRTAANATRINIGGTLVNADGFFGVTPQSRLGQMQDVRVVPVVRQEIHPAIDPTIAAAVANIRWKFFVEIIGVIPPREIQLPQIVQADNTVGFGLGFGQRGQEHAGQDGDNGDNHQQFDQRECACPGTAMRLRTPLRRLGLTHINKTLTNKVLQPCGLLFPAWSVTRSRTHWKPV